ncbi:MAG: Zn-ribbon domain-containing OB-fold protein [Methermicoccaceae archaeon]
MGISRFWREIPSRYNLIGTRCTVCGRYFYPPRNVCPNCRRSGHIEPYTFNGEGKVLTYTIIHTAARGFEQQVPYALAVVELDEGAKLTTQVVSPLEGMHIGMRVKSAFRRLGEDNEKGMIYYGTKFVPA